MNMLKISGFITKSTENWWHVAERNGFFETSSPFSFCSPAFFCMLTLTPILFWANSMISFFSFETLKFPRFPAFQWFYSFPLNEKVGETDVFWCQKNSGEFYKKQLAEKSTLNEDVSYWKWTFSCLFHVSFTKRVNAHDFWNPQGLGKRCYGGAWFLPWGLDSTLVTCFWQNAKHHSSRRKRLLSKEV